MKKYKLFFDPRKEEKWLNNIEGYRLVKVGILSYTFEKSKIKYYYTLNYTPGQFEYLCLLNNIKGHTKEIKHSFGWTYLESKDNKMYQSSEDRINNLKLFVRKYSLYSRAFLMFGIANLCLAISIHLGFLFCSICFFILTVLYQVCIKDTKKEIKDESITC